MTKEFQISVHEGFRATYARQIADIKKKLAEGDARVRADLEGALNEAQLKLDMHLHHLAELMKES